MKKFNRLQENSERKFSELRNKINEHKEFFIQETEILKNDQTEIQNSANVVKNAIQSISNRASQMEERVSGLVNRNTEIIQSGEKTKSRFLKSEETLQELQDSIRNANIRLTGVPEGEEWKKGAASFI